MTMHPPPAANVRIERPTSPSSSRWSPFCLIADPAGVSGHVALATVPPGHTTCLPEMRSMRSCAAPAVFRVTVLTTSRVDQSI
jgi:hypothetical protein